MKKMKYLPAILMAWPYLGLILLSLQAGDYFALEMLIGLAFLAYIPLTAVVYAGNIINACKYKEEGAELQLAFWDMVIKLVHIPFYLIVFMIGLVLLMAMVVPALLFVSPFMVMVLMVLDFFLMLTSSSYGISAILRARQKGMLSSGAAICHTILHLIFVMDTLSAVIVYIKLKRKQ